MIAARLLDVILALVLVVFLGEGWRNGILRSLSAIIGIFAGGAAAFFAVPVIASVVGSPDWRLTVSIAVGLVLIALGHLAGVAVAKAIRRRDPDGDHDLTTGERVFGALADLVAAALAVTLVAGSIAQLGVPVISQAVKRSIVISTIDRLTPGFVDDGLARVRAALFPEGLPVIEGPLGGIVAKPEQSPDVDTTTDPLADAARSVVRINGVAYACGQNQSGSGFVVAPERVMTNAHVVAGVSRPVVEAPDGQVLDGRVVAFDPELDVAIIDVPGLDAAPLPTGLADVGDRGVIDGYPRGGPFVSGPAEVLAVSTERVDDIYGDTTDLRDVVTLAGEVQPGNSGGPFIGEDGRVLGLVFARSGDLEGIGYATAMSELDDLLESAASLGAPIEPGRCIVGG